jgi:hypothetical protein
MRTADLPRTCRSTAGMIGLAALLGASCAARVNPTGGPGGTTGAGGSGAGMAGRGDGGAGGGPPGLDGGAPPTDGPGPTEDANCGLQNFMLDRRPAVVVLLQDRSTSMRNTLDGGLTRWATVVNAVKPALTQTQAGISWGFKFFPDGMVCGVPAGVNIEPALNNAAAINAQLDGIQVVQNSTDNRGCGTARRSGPRCGRPRAT